jgi:WD40-like Beta Propeller Repeat
VIESIMQVAADLNPDRERLTVGQDANDVSFLWRWARAGRVTKSHPGRLAHSGGCETLRKVYGPVFDSVCHDPHRSTGLAEHMIAYGMLNSLGDEALIEICRRNKIAECEKQQEVSKGRSILTFDSTVNLSGAGAVFHPMWSPDNRFLLVDNLPKREIRLLDVGSGRLLDPPIYAGPSLDAAAWSPDGKYFAFRDQKRAHPDQEPPIGGVRLYSALTLEELAIFAYSKDGCSSFGAREMAFTADSKALLVVCANVKNRVAKAIMLSVPGFAIEDSLIPMSSELAEPSYKIDGLSPLADDLILTARFRVTKAGTFPIVTAVQSFSLRTKKALHPAVQMDRLGSARLTDDLSGLYVGNELWSTESGQRIATGVNPSGRYLGAPDRIPQLGMHLESRGGTNSLRAGLVVIETQSGAAVQEIGPISGVERILVSPDGSRVAIFGMHEIRFYNVNQ